MPKRYFVHADGSNSFIFEDDVDWRDGSLGAHPTYQDAVKELRRVLKEEVEACRTALKTIPKRVRDVHWTKGVNGLNVMYPPTCSLATREHADGG